MDNQPESIKPSSPSAASQPQRVMGCFSATMIVVASMIGTGVFTTTGLLLQETPSAPAVLIAWLIGGWGAFFGAVSYAELVAMSPRNGGEYQLLSQIFHPSIGFVAGWISLIVGFSAPIASTAMAFGAYASTSFDWIDPFWAALIAILVFSLIHAIRVTLGTLIQNTFTALKLLLVGTFVIGGLVLGDFGNIFNEPVTQTASSMLSPGFAVGLIFVTYAYTGWNGSAYIAGEIKNPTKSLPRALALGTAIVTTVYLGLNAVFLAAAPTARLSGVVEVGSVAAISLFGEGIGRMLSAVISLLLLSSLSAMIMSGPRIYQSIGEDYPTFRFLARRVGGSGPFWAICLQTVIAVMMLLTTKFDALITYMGFTLSLNAALTVAGVFVQRIRFPNAKRPYRCWGYPVTPFLFIILSLWMVAFTIYDKPMVAVSGIITILSGLGLYALVARTRIQRPIEEVEEPNQMAEPLQETDSPTPSDPITLSPEENVDTPEPTADSQPSPEENVDTPDGADHNE